VPLTKIIAAGLMKAGGSEHDIQQAMDEEALRELPKVEKRTGYLAMLGNLATLAGLLGTITGLIKSFGAVAGVDPSMKATMLSKGISEAMNCTAFGLGTGIFGLAMFAVLNGRTQGILDGINQGTVEALNLVVAGRSDAGAQH
jgi:biopolymer transport protein ExbB/TolQ